MVVSSVLTQVKVQGWAWEDWQLFFCFRPKTIAHLFLFLGQRWREPQEKPRANKGTEAPVPYLWICS